jgi:hypothetical protein
MASRDSQISRIEVVEGGGGGVCFGVAGVVHPTLFVG